MDYVIRELRGDDVFPLLNILGKLEVTDEFGLMMVGGGDIELPALPKMPLDIIAKQAKGGTLSQKDAKVFEIYQEKLSEVESKRDAILQKRGAEAMGNIMNKVLLNATVVKNELNSFLADLINVDVTTIQNMKIAEYTTLVIKLFMNNDMKEVFTSAASLISSMKGQTSSGIGSTEDTQTH